MVEFLLQVFAVSCLAGVLCGAGFQREVARCALLLRGETPSIGNGLGFLAVLKSGDPRFRRRLLKGEFDQRSGDLELQLVVARARRLHRAYRVLTLVCIASIALALLLGDWRAIPDG